MAEIRRLENRHDVIFSPYFIFFVFFMQFGLWLAAAFVSSPIHLYKPIAVETAVYVSLYIQLAEAK